MVIQKLQHDYKNKIQKLPDDAIKDIWIRKKLYTHKRKHHREFKPGNFINSEEHDQIISQLKIGDNSSTLYHFLQERMYGLQEISQMKKSSKSREEWVFDDLTKDSYSEKKLVEEARKSLMATVEGIGMPLSRLVKNNIDKYAELEEI